MRCILALARLLEYNAGARVHGVRAEASFDLWGESVQPRVQDVERLKNSVRKMAAAQVLGGGGADVCLDLGRMEGCRARVAAGYGPLSKVPQRVARDRLIWILDGFVEVHDASGRVIHVRQGESTVLAGGQDYRLVFPQLSIYLRVEFGG
jgi:hypothetical protein